MDKYVYRLCLTFLGMLTVSTSSFAADEQPVSTTDKAGIKAGSFIILPQLSLGGLYDSNIFATRTNTHSDQVMLISPSVVMQSDWNKNQLKVRAGADIARYDDFTSENYNDFFVDTSGRIDLSPKANIFGGVGYAKQHESRTSPDGSYGLHPTEYYSTDAHLGTVFNLNNFAIRLGGTAQKLNFLDVATATSTLNNDDRDRDVYGLGLRVTYKKNEHVQPFMQWVLDQRNYVNQYDDNGFQRSSDGYRLAVGLSNTFGSVNGDVYLGHMVQNYDDPRFDQVSKPDFGLRMNWRSSPFTVVTANIDRAIEETTIYGASSALNTDYSLGVRHRILPQTTFHARLSYGQYEYQQISRKDNYLTAGFGLEHNLSRYFYLNADYQYQQRQSNLNVATLADSQDFYRHQLFLTVGARLYPVPASLMPELDAADDTTESTSGFYTGAQMGFDGIETNTGENRSSGGFDSGDFAKGGFSGGAFLGYGVDRDDWYYGLELNAQRDDANWYHSKQKSDSRTSSLSKDHGISLSARLGRRMLNNSLLYIKAGAQRGYFDGYYTINSKPQNAFNQSFTLTGLQLGLGMEYDLSEHLFGRFEYSYTDYPKKNISSVDFNDQFNTTESAINIGLGWRFDKVPYHHIHFDPKNYDGLYAGGQVGYGLLASNVSGQQRDQSTGPYNYNADFGTQTAVPGLFVGYGKSWHQWYAALELSADSASARWAHQRDTSGGGGRDFSLEMHKSLALNARLGYLLDSGTLLYLRGGPVRTEFNTVYVKGNNTANDIYRDDHLDGISLGFGTEVPLTQSTFVRLDYTHTRYDDINVVTEHGGGTNVDNVTFKPITDLVRLGLTFRF